MPIIKSAIKRMKQTAKRRERNINTKKEVKTAVKAFLEKPTVEGLRSAQSEIDTAVKKRVLNKGTADRRKSQLVKVAKSAGLKNEPAKKKSTSTTKPASKPAVKPTAITATEKPATAKKPIAKKAPAKKPAVKPTAKKTVPKK